MTPAEKIAAGTHTERVEPSKSNGADDAPPAWMDEAPPIEAYEHGSTPQPTPASVSLFALLWYATLDDSKPPEQIVKGLLLAASLFVVYGESNSGKTFWVLDIALAVAAGTPWRGRRTRGGLVIYVAGEGAASVRARVRAYRLTHTEVQSLPFAIVSQAVDFLSFDAAYQLISTIKAAERECGQKAVLVIVDTFARAVAGGDENSAQDVGAAVAAADRIRTETGAAVGFVHHSGKDPTKGARGSSALRAATDTEILVEGLSGQRSVTVTKQRDLESGQCMPFDLVPVEIGTDPDDGSPVTSCVIRHLEAEAAPPAVMRELRGKAQRQFVAALRARTESEPERIWSLFDLRHVGKELGLIKTTAYSVVDALTSSPYMLATVGGYKFMDGRATQ